MDTDNLKNRLCRRSVLDEKTGCIEWTGCVNNSGYGCINVEGRRTGTHRLAYVLAYGAIPDGLHVDHLCRNRSCINPDHLEAVSRRENLMRGIRTNQNVGKEFCLNGHEFKDENLYIKPNGARRCKECARARDRKYYWQRRKYGDERGIAEQCYGPR